MWIENSIPSVDFRSGRDCVKIRYDEYDKKYKHLNNKHPVETKKKTKLLHEGGYNIASGSIWNLKPFYLSGATDKEKVLCMCKLCLNFRTKFEAMMTCSKKFKWSMV